MRLIRFGLVAGFVLAGSVANAQVAAQATAPTDGMRLRNGISFSGGEEVGSGPSSGFSAALYGLDWRIGAQINNDWAVHAQTHLSFGSGGVGGITGYTGNFCETLMVERMLLDRFFVGAGGGYGVLNNPSGPVLQVRLGGYPLMTTDANEARRRGLLIGVDYRAYFAGELIGTVSQISVAIGYEKF